MDANKTTVVLGPPGCISGEAVICLNRFGNARNITLAQFYQQGLAAKSPTNGKRKVTTRSLTAEGLFRLNEILAVTSSGIKDTITISSETKRLSLTPDHQVLTDRGWLSAGNLSLGTRIFVESAPKKSDSLTPNFCYLCGKPIRLKLSQKHPCFGQCYSCIVLRLRETKPDAAIEKNGYILRKAPWHPRNHRGYVLEHILVIEQKLGRILLPREKTHHADENVFNNDPSNLELTTAAGHFAHHSWYKNLSMGVFVPQLEKIQSISYYGKVETFDLSMASPDNNFIANGIVVHNCGKTHHLLDVVDGALNSGTRPDKVAFVSFTKKATDEARSRASAKFSLPEEDFPHFRTLHSFAFKHLNMRRDQVVGWQHLKELGKFLGLEFKGRGEVLDGDVYGMGAADRILFMEGLARNSRKPLKLVWEEAMEDSVDFLELDRFSRSYAEFKKSRGLYDFTDMMERFVKSDPLTMPQLDLLALDEGQDTSTLQWEAVELLAHRAKQVYVGGDDAQAIYTWSGANVQKFIDLPGRQTTLSQSYRVPSTVHTLADSISNRISKKRARNWKPRPEKGAVNWFNSVDEIDLAKGTWLLLARNGYMLKELEDFCLSQGFSFRSVSHDPLKSPVLSAIRIWESLRRGNYEAASKIPDGLKYMHSQLVPASLLKKLKSEEAAQMFSLPELVQLGLGTTAIWHQCMTKISPAERDFLFAAGRRKEPLLKEPRIKISTIHASKGGQADHILLLTDMSYRCAQNAENNMDDEARVFYVAVTRCKETLNIVMPRTNMAFAI